MEYKIPKHYDIKGIDKINSTKDFIDLILDNDNLKPSKAFDKGNVLKYLIRAEHKNGLEDYKKAMNFLKMLIEKIEKENL